MGGTKESISNLAWSRLENDMIFNLPAFASNMGGHIVTNIGGKGS